MKKNRYANMYLVGLESLGPWLIMPKNFSMHYIEYMDTWYTK
jgi:hypothetical protein